MTSETQAGRAASPFDDAIAESLEAFWGFTSLRPLQREAIDAALSGRDALVVLPTGGGKSLCYQLPPLIRRSLTIVVSPLIALMQDQIDGLRLAGYPAAALHSHVSAEERAGIMRACANGELRLLLIAPERLFGDGFLQWATELGVGAFAIDEAHCISQWGHDFRPEYRRLRELRERFPGVPFQAYTATATPRVQQDILTQLGLRDPAVLIGTFDRPNLTYRVHPRVDRKRQVVEAVARHQGAAAIVYCISRKDTESVAEELRASGVDAAAYHAGLSGDVRSKISADFRAERLPVVVATVAFGMGIDRGDVRLVVHAAMPKSVEHYQQETGRAGRDGLPSECLLLYSAGDAAKWRTIMERSAAEFGGPGDALTAQLELLAHMHRLANGLSCRHRTISEYFGQSYAEQRCGACDVCLDEFSPIDDAHVTAQKILSAVARCGQRFGSKHIIDVLRGSRAQRVVARGHDKLSTFGLLANLTAQRIGNFIDQLVDAGDLERSGGEYPVLTLTEGSMQVMRGERPGQLFESKAAIETRAGSRRERGSRGGEVASRDGGGPPLDAVERSVFEVLREWRRERARELGTAPYLIFGDVTFYELARVRPSTLDAMRTVRGIGDKRLESFGASVLEVLARHCEAHGLERDVGLVPAARSESIRSPVEPKLTSPTAAPRKAPVKAAPPAAPAADGATARVATESQSSSARQQALREAAKMFAIGSPVADVAARLDRAERTVLDYLVEYIQAVKPQSVAPWVDDVTYAAVRAALHTSEDGRYKPIFEALGGRVSYDHIRIVAVHVAVMAEQANAVDDTASA